MGDMAPTHLFDRLKKLYGNDPVPGDAPLKEALNLMGYWPIHPFEITKVLFLTAILFAGPLYERGIVEGSWRDWIRGRYIGEVIGSWMGWRNFVAGPITEEIVFRSAIVPLHLLAKVASKRVVFITPLYFGIAHIHHFYEYTLTHPHTPLLPALLRSVVQFTYTSIFGFYATFIFLRTGSLPAVILAHSFCNWCGLPRLWGRVEAGVPLGPPSNEERERKDERRSPETSAIAVGDSRLNIGWTVAYYFLLVIGAVIFCRALWPLTDSRHSLAQFEFTYFSYDEHHQLHLDASSLRYYYPPQLGADLCRGYDTFQQLDDTRDDHLDSLLTAVMAHERETGAKSETDFITWRGMITKIMATPYENFNGFEMNATKFQGTIFIEENHAYKLQQRQGQHNQQPRRGAASQDMMSFWGYKFETLSLIPQPWAATPREVIERRDEEIVNNHSQYCSVVKTGIGKAKMIIGGEVDAIWDSKPTNKDAPINWVELKTAEAPSDDRDMLKFERKLLKFWIQSFLLGVPIIVVGFRSKDGILRSLEKLDTQSIPNNVKRKGKGSWDGNLCINFTASFLEWLKSTITSEGVWTIKRRERSPIIEVQKTVDVGHGDILTPEFVAWRQELASTAAV
ncbi:MAG: hypothetical protein M1825_003683 [Sarcosagium campestre]|nr:MAG: hypothetical protein M1825_003683 [Sarcosagium campestre]